MRWEQTNFSNGMVTDVIGADNSVLVLSDMFVNKDGELRSRRARERTATTGSVTPTNTDLISFGSEGLVRGDGNSGYVVSWGDGTAPYTPSIYKLHVGNKGIADTVVTGIKDTGNTVPSKWLAGKYVKIIRHGQEVVTPSHLGVGQFSASASSTFVPVKSAGST